MSIITVLLIAILIVCVLAFFLAGKIFKGIFKFLFHGNSHMLLYRIFALLAVLSIISALLK